MGFIWVWVLDTYLSLFLLVHFVEHAPELLDLLGSECEQVDGCLQVVVYLCVFLLLQGVCEVELHAGQEALDVLVVRLAVPAPAGRAQKHEGG
jgi:hypothetical protein